MVMEDGFRRSGDGGGVLHKDVIKTSSGVVIICAGEDVFSPGDGEKQNDLSDRRRKKNSNNNFVPRVISIDKVGYFVEGRFGIKGVVEVFESLEVVVRNPSVLPDVHF